MSALKNRVREAVLSFYRSSPRVRDAYRATRQAYARRRLRLQARRRPCRVVIGANGKFQEGWIPTEIYTLDVSDPESWRRYFPPGSIDALLAEHVWEHLTPEDAAAAARLCKLYLKPGGHLRVAVPDGCFPNPGYIDWVKPGGSGPSADDHKVLFTHRTLATHFEEAGFDVRLLEYYDDNGDFHARDWDPADGNVVRSRRYAKGRTFGGRPYTSLVLDARKPPTAS